MSLCSFLAPAYILLKYYANFRNFPVPPEVGTKNEREYENEHVYKQLKMDMNLKN